MNREQEMAKEAMRNIVDANAILSEIAAEKRDNKVVMVDCDSKTSVSHVREKSSQAVWKDIKVADMSDIHVANAAKFIHRNPNKFSGFKEIFHAFVIEIEYRSIWNLVNFDNSLVLGDAIAHWNNQESCRAEAPMKQPSAQDDRQPVRYPKCIIKNGRDTISVEHCLPLFDSIIINRHEYVVDEIVYNSDKKCYEVYTSRK